MERVLQAEKSLNRVSHAVDFGDDGYTLDPDRTIDGMVLANRDRAEAVAGGCSRYPDSVIASVENTFDLFGEVNALIT